jgi:hypothetical protein
VYKLPLHDKNPGYYYKKFENKIEWKKKKEEEIIKGRKKKRK